MDLHRRRSVLVRMAADGRKLETARITNSPAELRRQAEITVLEAVIADLLAHHDGYHAIRALPGIGPVLAAMIVAETGDITRFTTPARLCSWAGPTPRHRESDTKVSRGHITKQGSPIVRWALVCQCTFSSTTGKMSQTCAHDQPASLDPAAGPARSAPHPRHSAGASAVPVRSGTAAGVSPDPLCPCWPPGLRSAERSREDRSAERFALRPALAAIESFDDGVDEFPEFIPRRRRNSAFSASSPSTRDPGGLFAFHEASSSSRQARWLVRVRSSGWPFHHAPSRIRLSAAAA